LSRLLLRPRAADDATMPSPGDASIPGSVANLMGEAWPALLTPAKAAHASGSPLLDRAAAAALIGRLNAHLPPPPPEARYIVAGQQAGLLTGPLYTFLKAVTAIRLAGELEAAGGAPVLPLFWIASEDHDVLEVNRVTIQGRRFVHEYAGPLSSGAVPQVAEIDIREARDPLLAFLREALPPTEFTAAILELVAAADFASYATAFRDLLRGLFSRWPLRVVDPLALRPLTAPVLARLAERASEWPERLAAGAADLSRGGLKAPLAAARIYEVGAGRRAPFEIDTPEAAELIRRAPERFSAGAALRPICQDAVLPVLATVAGPTELAYLRQIEPLYPLADARPSLRHPRISATFLTPALARAAARAGLEPERVLAVSAWIAAGGAAAEDPGGRDDADPSALEIRERARALLEEIDRRRPDPSPRWFRRGREAIASGVERILAELAEERRARRGRDRANLEKLAAGVWPEGGMQERAVNVFQFVNLFGPEFVDRAVESLDPWDRRHQVVTIEARGEGGAPAEPGAQGRPGRKARGAPDPSGPDPGGSAAAGDEPRP